MRGIRLALTVLSLHPASGQIPLRPAVEPVDPVELKRVYDHYVESDFADIAIELARQAGENPVLQGSIPGENRSAPWTHSLALTLLQAWQFHTGNTAQREERGKALEILMTVVESERAGAGRPVALAEIAALLQRDRRAAQDDRVLPSLESTVERLTKVATNQTQDTKLRLATVAILFEHGDPNRYLGLAAELSSREGDPVAVAEAFRFATPSANPNRLTPENRAWYLAHAFELLERTNDRKSGAGYFLAMHIGDFSGIRPERPGQGAFAPDQTLPEYQGAGGLNEAFFQKTVDNALDWWARQRKQAQGTPQLPGP